MITDEDIKYIFNNLEEKRDIEFKENLNWTTNDAVKAKIAKSLMAFSNIRNGGYLVIGVRQNPDNSFTPVGMTTDAFDSHRIDDVMPYVNSKAEPPVNFEMEKIEKDGMKFVIYKVYEFDELPVFCKNDDGNSILHKGVIYVRTMRMYETAPIQNQSEMREIRKMLVDKNIEELKRLLQQYEERELGDDHQFDKELGGL